MPPFTLPEVLPCLVAFSGGADSRLLLELTLRALLERDGEEGRRQVVAAHLHHGIRGEEADRDLTFCQRVCAELGVALVFDRVDVPAMAAESGESLETAARRARYDFFGRVMAEQGISVLMTAHHADDNLETVLERLLRGSGTRGMGGIPSTRMLADHREGRMAVLYRPLLEWTRRDILAACREWGLDYITDSTNEADDCLRNRIRHTVVPALEAIAGEDAPQRAAYRMTRITREDEDFLNGVAERQIHTTLSPHGEGLGVEDLRGLHPAISKRALMALYRNALLSHTKGEGQNTLSAVHVEALLELGCKGLSESFMPLPGGMEGRVRDGFLYVLPAAPADGPLPPDEPVALDEGTTPWGDVTVTVERCEQPLRPCEGKDVFASAVFPATLPLPLTARGRRAGDTILSHGMTKKLKKLLCDKDVPLYLRDRIPLICLPDGTPLWYPSAAFRDGYPAPTEGPCVRITLYRMPSDRCGSDTKA
jgi:tRNA(Ile)-lysidine synthase